MNVAVGILVPLACCEARGGQPDPAGEFDEEEGEYDG